MGGSLYARQGGLYALYAAIFLIVAFGIVTLLFDIHLVQRVDPRGILGTMSVKE